MRSLIVAAVAVLLAYALHLASMPLRLFSTPGEGEMSEPTRPPIPIDALHLRERSLYQNDRALERLVHNGSISFHGLGLPDWPVPVNPSWTENPHADPSWELYYHSLVWLLTHAYAFEKTGDESHLRRMAALVDSYMHADRRQSLPAMAWDDHTTALRLEVLVFLFRSYLEDHTDGPLRARFAHFTEQHATRLEKRLRNPAFRAHNHGLIHALSMLNYVRGVPALARHEQRRRQRSRERIAEVVRAMTCLETGASLEQSMDYHYLAYELFADASRFLKKIGEPIDFDFPRHMTKMREHAAYLMYPNGRAPAFGDSTFGKLQRDRLRGYARRSGSESAVVEAVVRGTYGAPMREVYVSRAAGHVVLRPQAATGGSDWKAQPMAFVSFGKRRFSHGHFDQMSFTAYRDGLEFLVHAGGPFSYKAGERQSFWSATQSNSVVIDGVTEPDADAVLRETGHDGVTTFATGSIEIHGVRHVRTIAWVRTDTGHILATVDRLQPGAGQRSKVDSRRGHEYAWFFHYHPELRIIRADERGVDLARISPSGEKSGRVGERRMHGELFASSPITHRAHRAERNAVGIPHLGWVVTGFRRVQPADVSELRMKAGRAWLVSLWTTTPNESSQSWAVGQNDEEELEIRVGGTDCTFGLDRHRFDCERRMQADAS